VCRCARLRGVASFSAALAVIGILSAALTQLPRLELSGLLSLRTFGYFSVATVAVSGLYALVTPVFQAVFPQLSNLLDTGSPRLAGVYHHACQLVSAVVLPVALVLIFFSRQILLVWTGSTDAANGTWLVLTLLAIGTGMHALYWIPYALQLAGKWTALALWQNSIAVAVLVPFTFVAAHQWGAPGAAAGWIALNAGYVTIGIH